MWTAYLLTFICQVLGSISPCYFLYLLRRYYLLFSTNVLDQIDDKYFKVINKDAFTVTLQSKNTKHCWHILLQEYGRIKSCSIYHTHHAGTAYHLHGHAGSLLDALEEIYQHDEYHLTHRVSQKKQQR